MYKYLKTWGTIWSKEPNWNVWNPQNKPGPQFHIERKKNKGKDHLSLVSNYKLANCCLSYKMHTNINMITMYQCRIFVYYVANCFNSIQYIFPTFNQIFLNFSVSCYAVYKIRKNFKKLQDNPRRSQPDAERVIFQSSGYGKGGCAQIEKGRRCGPGPNYCCCNAFWTNWKGQSQLLSIN